MRARLPSFLVPLLFTVACSTPQPALVNLWIDPEHVPEPTQHVMVVALWQDADARRLWEERFSDLLKQTDAEATPSYKKLSAPMPDSTAVFREARNRRCDGVIVIHQHILDRGSYYLPGITQPEKQKVPRWFHSTGATEVWAGDNAGAAGYNTLSCDVEMWTPDRAGMVWSGTTEVLDPGSDDYAASTVASAVVKELVRLGLVSSRF